MPRTTAERQAAFKARLKEAGLVRVEVFVPPERRDEIKRIAANMSTKSDAAHPAKGGRRQGE